MTSVVPVVGLGAGESKRVWSKGRRVGRSGRCGVGLRVIKRGNATRQLFTALGSAAVRFSFWTPDSETLRARLRMDRTA